MLSDWHLKFSFNDNAIQFTKISFSSAITCNNFSCTSFKPQSYLEDQKLHTQITKNLLICETLFIWENVCLWLFKISIGMHFIPLQSIVCVSYHCRNEISTQLGYHRNWDFQIYTIDYPPSIMKPSKSDPFCCYDNTVWCHTNSAMVWNAYHAPQWYEMHTSATFGKLKTHIFSWVVGSGDGAGQLPVPGRPTTLAYGRAGACCACSRCGMDGLCFFCFLFCCCCCCFVDVVVVLFFKSRLSYLPFLMPHLLGDGWTFWNIVVSAVLTQR